MPLPKLTNEPGAIELARQIAKGEISAVAAVDAAIARIEALDGPINAVVVRDFEQACAAARAADARRAAGTAGALNGVPVTVKESFNIAGLKTTWGFESTRDFVAHEDAHVVKQLKAAGAIVLGKTNVPTTLANQSGNPIYGRTSNPHDLTRAVGGSSGGGAAALAAGMVPLEFGRDIGSAIRIPCHFCGVMGLKPTYGAISFDGCNFPSTDGAPAVMAMPGPMARCAEDLALALDLTSYLPLPRSRYTDLKNLRILVLDSHPVAVAGSAVQAALRGAADAAANAGAIVTHDSPLIPEREEMFADYLRLLGIAMSPQQLTPSADSEIGMREWFGLLDKQARTIRQWQRLFTGFDAVLTPVHGAAAPKHSDDPDWHSRPFTIDGVETAFFIQLAWLSQASYTNLPSVTVPVGSDGHLPIGIQVITPHWQDHLAIAIAGMLHKILEHDDIN